MRKFLLSLGIASTLLLSNCATFGPGPGGNGPNPGAIVEQVLQITAAVCDFIPTVATITQILDVGAPGLSTATQIATAICAAVVPPRAAGPGQQVAPARLGKVAGVQVRGRFAR